LRITGRHEFDDEVYNHEPVNYVCPLCTVVGGGTTALDSQDDIVERTQTTITLMSSFWYPARPGNVLVLPTAHYENLFDLPSPIAHAVADAVKRVAVAMRTVYDCAGITVRQNNEPAGDQEIWHFHTHVLPRRKPLELLTTVAPVRADQAAARAMVEKLRAELRQ
jgi:histidine triad (HIT) family protein